MSATVLELVLTASLLVLVGATAAAAVVGYLGWRYVRRRTRAFRSHGLVLGATALWQSAATTRWGRRGSDAPDVVELRSWTSGQVRRALWRGVDGAAAAVRAADEVGAVVADLPSLCRHLEASAADLDKVLRIDAAGPVPLVVAEQVAHVLQAAAEVRAAAQASAGHAAGERVHHLVEDAARELHLLEVGMASMRASGPAAGVIPASAAPAPEAGSPGLPAPPR
jgi:hypothetical protein